MIINLKEKLKKQVEFRYNMIFVDVGRYSSLHYTSVLSSQAATIDTKKTHIIAKM